MPNLPFTFIKHIFNTFSPYYIAMFFFFFFAIFSISLFYRISIIFAFAIVNLFENWIEKKRRQSSIAVAFTRSPFLLDRGCCACLPSRHGVPPLRSWGQSISNLTFLPTNDLVHRRIYESLLFLSFLHSFRFCFHPSAFILETKPRPGTISNARNY